MFCHTGTCAVSAGASELRAFRSDQPRNPGAECGNCILCHGKPELPSDDIPGNVVSLHIRGLVIPYGDIDLDQPWYLESLNPAIHVETLDHYQRRGSLDTYTYND